MGFLKNALSTRRAMQKTPSMPMVHELSDQELKALQACFLEIIKDIDRVCEKRGICYMAAGGTALGSVRHQGFIPWDDDVDLLMPRPDLKRFLEIFDEELGDKYEITSPDSKYPLESMITAVYKKNTYKASISTLDTDLPKGVHIDLFPIETVPVNPLARRIKGLTAIFLQYVAVSSLFRHLSSENKKEFFYQTPAGKFNYRLRMFVGALFSFRSYEKWAASFDRFVSCKTDTGLWAVPTDIGHYFGHIMPKEVYYPPIKGPFVDMQINLPHNPDEYLKNQYGDYMTIPPEADREKHWSIGFSLDLEAEGKA
ncbi:MAG: LicD family protein [Oscillospiraceae bacterium]|nr:LicD family protein [Oscillospiraceae bacterium]